jgi:rfaE bifunctional protein kinase chain/domain
MTPARAKEILKRFKERKVLVLGDCMLDHWLWGSVTRISPEAPVPVVDIERSTFTPGGAANVVHNISSLGASSGIVGVVGHDESGRTLRRILEEQGAQTDALIADKHRPTTTKTRIIAHSQQVVRADAERREPVNGELAKRVLKAVHSIEDGYDALLVSDYHKGVITPALLHPMLESAVKRQAVIVVQPKPDNMKLFKDMGVTVVAVNEREARAATGLSTDDDAHVEVAARSILDTIGSRIVVITRGPKGMSVVSKGDSDPHHVPAFARQVYDVSGAGDTVVSVLTLALACDATPVEATNLANFAAAVVVQKVGTATVTIDEILGAMKEHV